MTGSVKIAKPKPKPKPKLRPKAKPKLNANTKLKAEPADAALRVRKIGNSIGVILPKDLLARLDLKEGAKLHVIEGPDRALKLSPYDPSHAKALDIARKSFRTYANAYKALAK